MFRKLTTIVSLAMIMSFTAANVQADLLCYWNFNNNTQGSPSSNLGTFNTTGSVEIYNASSESLSVATSGVYASTATVELSDLVGTMGGSPNNNWGTFAGATNNALNDDTSGGALSVVGSGNNGHYVDFTVSTLGYGGLIVSFATRGTSTGYTTQVWSYSNDGVNFISFATLTGRNVTSFSTQTIDFSSIESLNNKSNVIFRVTFDGATSTNGNNRIDNVQINGTVVPEPVTIALLSSGPMMMYLRRRKA
jgi:hypothetical protein